MWVRVMKKPSLDAEAVQIIEWSSTWKRDSSGTPFVCFVGRINYQEPPERRHSRMNIAVIERQTTSPSVTEI
jgi:hypothetical protein